MVDSGSAGRCREGPLPRPLSAPEGHGAPAPRRRRDQQDRPRRRSRGRGARRGVRAVHRPRRRRRPESTSGAVYERQGRHRDANWTCPARISAPCSTCWSPSHAPPRHTPGHPLQLLVTNLTANEYVGRMAVAGSGTARSGWASESRDPRGSGRHGGQRRAGRTVTLTGAVTALQTARESTGSTSRRAVPATSCRWPACRTSRSATRSRSLAIHDPAAPRRRSPDPPHESAVNTSPLAGREGRYVTSRQIKARLDARSWATSRSRSTRRVRRQPSRCAAGRTAAGGPHETDAARGLRAHGLAAGGDSARDARRAPGAIRAEHGRHPARLHRRGPGRAGGPEGPARADDDRCGWARPNGVRAAGSRADRLSRPAPDRHPRDGAAAPDRRGLRAVGRRGDPSNGRRAGHDRAAPRTRTGVQPPERAELSSGAASRSTRA